MKATWGDTEARVGMEDELRSVITRVQSLGEPTMLFLEHDNPGHGYPV